MNVLYTDKYDKNKQIIEHDDYIEARGGDGTLLRAINMFRNKNKPFFGRAGGTLNFLMNDSKEPIEDAHYVSLDLIKVKITKKSWKSNEKEKQTYQAFNEICIGGSNGMNSWIEFNVQEKDKLFGNFKGGGLIISTPQGSTGINKNNGGSILSLSAKLWSITGDKTSREIRSVFKQRSTTITFKAREEVIVWIDGSYKVIEDVESVEISKGKSVTLIFNDYDEFIEKRKI